MRGRAYKPALPGGDLDGMPPPPHPQENFGNLDALRLILVYSEANIPSFNILLLALNKN